MLMTAIVTLAGAYLLGSINFAVLFCNAFCGRDVRNYGSGNAGATNALRVGGAKIGVLTFACDFIKGLLAAGMGLLIFRYMGTVGVAYGKAIYGAYACGVACMLGHVFPIFFHFKGGKGVATGVGIFLVCSWQAILIALAVFAVLFAVTRYVSLSSLVGTLVGVVLSFVFADPTAPLWVQMIFSLILGVIIFWRHSENIHRLLAGEEKKFGKGGRKNG